MRYVAAFGSLAALLVLAGCGNESDPPPDAGQEPTVSQSNEPSRPPSTPTPPTTGPSSPQPSPSGSPVDQATADLAGRLGVGPGAVTLVSREEVTWPDGGLGCPEPGMQYTQALVNGSRIVLESGGKHYHYHSGGRRGPFLCTNPQPPVTTS